LVTAIYLQKPIYEELPKYLREVQLLVRRHDEDNWRIWKTVTPIEFAGDVTVQVLATQLAVPYVDANTLITAGIGRISVSFVIEGSFTTSFKITGVPGFLVKLNFLPS